MSLVSLKGELRHVETSFGIQRLGFSVSASGVIAIVATVLITALIVLVPRAM